MKKIFSKEDLDVSIDLITKKGFKRILYVDLTRSEIEVPVARVNTGFRGLLC